MVQESNPFPNTQLTSDLQSLTNKYSFEDPWCSLCMERWTHQGDHQVSCIPCGHVYGFSCITEWKKNHLGQPAQCPQPECNSTYELEDIRKLYTSPAIRPDEYLMKNIKHLEAENECLKTERNINKELQEMVAHRSQISESIHKLNSDRKASYDASTMVQDQLKSIIAERDELSNKLSGMETLLGTITDQLKIAHASSAQFSQYTTTDTAKLQTEILDRLREIELQAFTAKDRVVQLQTEIMEQRARIAETGFRLLSSQSSDGGNTSESKAQGSSDYISVLDVVQLLLNLSKGVATSLDSVNKGKG